MGSVESGRSGIFSRAGGWLWVLVGLVTGAVLLGTLIPIVLDVPPRPDVAILVGALSVLLMGVLVGYHSPGRTLLEPGLAGAALAVLALLFASLDTELGRVHWAVGAVGGGALGAAGGVVGEILQASVERGPHPGLGWPWILVGTILGVVLNVYSVFIPRGLFGWEGLQLLASFAASFFVVGVLVGYLSPGVTILEPALSAFGTILVDLILVSIGFSVPFPLIVAVMAAVVAFAIALLGGWVGEVAHALRTRSSMGGEAGEFTRVPTPGGSRSG